MRLAKDLTPVQPPAHVWAAVQRRLKLTAPRPALFRMRSFALAASIVLVVAVAGLLYWHSLQSVRATVVATVSAKSGEHVWELEVFGKLDRLVAHAAKLPARPAGSDFELWALPKGRAPVSLGVLPAEGAATRTLTPIQSEALANSSQVAVSIEPRGGSPTGQPTGDIVFVAPLRTPS